MCILNLNVVFLLLLALFEIAFSQRCDFDEFACISCTNYQKCNLGYPEEMIISCANGSGCNDEQLIQCQMKLNCYALNECTQAGIFPDVMVDSNYFVCLSDGGSGFLKYEFTCPEDNFFDDSSLSCVPRNATSAETTIDPTSPLTTTETTPTITETTPSTTETTPSTTETTPSTTETTPSTTETTPSTTETTPSTTETTPSTAETTPSTTETTPSTTETTPSTTETTPSTTETTPTTIGTIPTTETTPSTTITNPTLPPITTPLPTTPPFACPTAGIFPYPGNCKMYYRCSTSLKVFFYICPGNSYFNENTLKCSLIITPACQEQILKNSTSTITPPTTIRTTVASTTTTPLATTTTTTPKPTTTTTTTTTTTPKPTTTPTTTATPLTVPTATPSTTTSTTAAPFSCLGTGAFENPADCKTYFRCSISGQVFRYFCPGNTYFNELTKRCSLVMTPRCRNLKI